MTALSDFRGKKGVPRRCFRKVLSDSRSRIARGRCVPARWVAKSWIDVASCVDILGRCVTGDIVGVAVK